MEYSIPEITNGLAKIVWPDQSWTFVPLTEDMTEADLDDIVHRITPPHLLSGSTPSFLSAGATRTAAAKTTQQQKAHQCAKTTPEAKTHQCVENTPAAKRIEFLEGMWRVPKTSPKTPPKIPPKTPTKTLQKMRE